MKIIVGNMTHKLREFIKKYHFTSKIIVINKMCNVKTIKGEVDIIIPFAKIEPNGLITNTQVHFEELLMSVNVKSTNMEILMLNLHLKKLLIVME